ncbi:ABC transporter permease [Glaciihabitans sp. INWT7]|uniref:ABC transporter permease n=1 Tax=Glaciihabitans sp. INWT7 TaxID=2596912 RepID=UPI00162540BD|nr:ABC transporter permease [Glaciihabitans sp. INWT7]QNE48351.1 ABC transporter permease [Glaciihabitans sp. INWT7]
MTARARGGLWHGLLRSRKAVVGLVILAAFLTVAALTPVIFPGDASAYSAAISQPPSLAHLFGTTAKGQDVLALTMWGSRTSLLVGLSVGVAATLLGVLVGLVSAHYGGAIDEILSVITNIFLLIPGLPLLVVLAAFLPPGLTTIVFVLAITGWAGSARVLRAQALSLQGKEFVAAAKVTGERGASIIFREILPNMASVVMTTVVGCVIFGIGAQAGLEFLGLGDVNVVSWGSNLYWASNDGSLLVGSWWTFIPSGLSIALVAFALALINYGVDEVTNPRLRSNRKVKANG